MTWLWRRRASRNVTITVRMLPNEVGVSKTISAGSIAQCNNFEIMVMVAPTEIGKSDLVSTLAHELGHVVASIAATEACLNDPRHMGKGEMLPAEVEAWEIARSIYPQLDWEYAMRCLDSYR